MKNNLNLIAKERLRQINEEGWTAAHDEQEHGDNDMAHAAACYALADVRVLRDDNGAHILWPWDKKWWKPTPDNRLHELTKAGALIVSEMDRLTKGRGCPTSNASAADPGYAVGSLYQAHDGTVVMVTDKGKDVYFSGVVVKGSDDGADYPVKIGDYATDFVIDSFFPYTGTILLENE